MILPSVRVAVTSIASFILTSIIVIVTTVTIITVDGSTRGIKRYKVQLVSAPYTKYFILIGINKKKTNLMKNILIRFFQTENLLWF